MSDMTGDGAGVEVGDHSLGGLGALRVASEQWVRDGRRGPLGHWLERELDPDGVPRRLEVTDWGEGLDLLRRAAEGRAEGWPERFDARAEGWFRALLRFSRPGGLPVFGATNRRGPDFFRGWTDRLSDPGLATVVDWWFPPPKPVRHAAPPLPADARPDRPLAVLRANWVRDGDLLAVDHRTPGDVTRFEVMGLGVRWLGPAWSSGAAGGPFTRPKPTLWTSHSAADVAEWSYRVGPARVVRTAVLLRGRRLALLAEQWDGPGDPGRMTLPLADGIAAGPAPGSDVRAVALTPTRGRGSARVYPIGLPALNYPTERGGIDSAGGKLVLHQPAAAGAKRAWRALVVSWEPRRNRQPVRWRTLTVSESSRACRPDAAFGARITWGRDETLLIYRSLTRPALRAVLGYQTRVRFLIALFSRNGEVEPILKVED